MKTSFSRKLVLFSCHPLYSRIKDLDTIIITWSFTQTSISLTTQESSGTLWLFFKITQISETIPLHLSEWQQTDVSPLEETSVSGGANAFFLQQCVQKVTRTKQVALGHSIRSQPGCSQFLWFKSFSSNLFFLCLYACLSCMFIEMRWVEINYLPN